MPTWTAEQEQVLIDHGHRGPEYCAALIARKYHVKRSAQATERHANRIGAPMIVYHTCPECGRLVKKLNRNTGTCDACNAWRLANRWKDIRKQLEVNDEKEVERARKEYSKERQRVSRLKKGGCEEYVDLSENLSGRRSEAQKSFQSPA